MMSRTATWRALLMLVALLTGCVSPSPLKAPSHDPPKKDAANECARGVLLDAYRSIPNHDWDDYKQVRLPDNAPLQSLPRLTAPYFADLLNGRCQPTIQSGDWFIPVIFDLSNENVRDGSSADASPADFLSFWLEPADASDNPDAWIPLEVDTASDATSLIPDPNRHSHMIGRKPLEALVFRVNHRTAKPGFYWLRIVPRFPIDGIGQMGAPGRDILDGNLPQVLTGPSLEAVDYSAMADIFSCRQLLGLHTCRHPYKHFWPQIRDVFEVLTKADAGGGSGGAAGSVRPAPGDPSFSIPGCRKSAQNSSRTLQQALFSLYCDRAPAGVMLSEGARPQDGSFSFVVGGDVQNSQSTERFRRLLDIITSQTDCSSPTASRKTSGEACDAAGKVEDYLEANDSEVKFVLLAGDLADAQAGSNPFVLAMNAFGLWPPRSSYENDYRNLSDVIRGARIPVVGVPGNHDGYVGYLGLVNEIVTLGGRLRFADRLNDFIPVFVKLPGARVFVSRPRYDGLGEWRHAMGPTSYAFSYKGHTFAGLNTFNLSPSERAAVGAVVFNWGGGVQEEDVVWLANALGGLPDDPTDPNLRQFLFMHHDPRAGTPAKPEVGRMSRRIDCFGLYDEMEIAASFLTFGHFGLGHSPYWDVYFPVLTPLVHQVSRVLGQLMQKHSVRLQEEWMRKSFQLPFEAQTDTYYNAEELVLTINAFLREPGGRGGVSHIFFGHNNLVLEEPWSNGQNKVFPIMDRCPDQVGPYNGVSTWLRPFVKMRTDAPDEWALDIRANGEADVIHMDDIDDQTSDDHGFHIVTVKTKNGITTVEKPKWFDLP